MALLALICLPFAAASLLALLGSAPRRVQVAVAAAANGMALALLLSLGPAVLAGAAPVFRIPWVPALGLDVSLWLDPLALLFAGLILGIGLLVVIYAAGYLAAAEPTGRFLSLLMLFQGAMIGIALSGNIILMLVFWELTSLSSFLLIGFWRDEAAARQGARMALTVTGGGGLALVGGMLLLGQAAGSFELQTILARGAAVQASPLFPVMLVLILLGAFTKSAQFPFHFWLPHAMAAPTPVSAYLHSATMVKAGVFLLARLWPVLAGGDLWFGLVATTGLVTMVSGAGMALVRHDLKTILAYSTVSQLGMMMMLLGFGTPAAAAAAMFHMLNHAAFKAALFMVAGIVDHATGTRDLRRLGGLAALMPITAAAGTLATAAMAGLPPMGGFISKELMLGESLRATILGRPWLLPGLATVGALLSTAYSFRLAGGLFLGRRRSGDGAAAHDPGAATMVPPVLLAMAALGLGIAPMLLAGPLVVAVAGAVTGGAAPHLDLALWHGINPALGLGLAAIVLGALTGWRFAPVTVEAPDRRLPDARRMFDAALTGMVAGLRRASDWLHAASLQRHLFILFAVVVALGFDGARAGGIAAGARPTLPTGAAAIVGWFALMAATLAVVLAQRRRLLALLFVSVIGLVVALAFVHLSAPDLALTQIATEVVTVILLLLTLHLLPKQPPRLSSMPRRARDGALAVVAGIGAGWLAWAMMTRCAVTGVSAYHWANSYSGGGGTNVVNVTLVDFRAFDTLGEIVVLGVAGLVIFALLEPASRGVAGRRLREWRDDMPHSPERHPVMFVMAARLLLPLALLVGIHIFLRGHNRPGGGFVAALVVAIAVLLQYLASGFDWTDARRRIGEHQLIASGVLIATATGLGSLLFGAPFLSSSFGYFHPPLLGEVELATAMLFDLGVAAAVVGAVMMALAQLSHVAQRAARHAEEDGAA